MTGILQKKGVYPALAEAPGDPDCRRQEPVGASRQACKSRPARDPARTDTVAEYGGEDGRRRHA